MKLDITLSDDDMDKITVLSLKSAYKFNAGYNTIVEPDYAFLKSVDHVLEYFLNQNELQEWQAQKAMIHEQEGTSPPHLEV